MANVNIYNMADTWTVGATTYTSVKMNVTDTASAAASLLIDLQVGGASKFKVDKDGVATLAVASFTSAVASYPNLSLGNQSGWGLHLASTAIIGWSSTADYTVAKDLFLTRAAAGTLNVRAAASAAATISTGAYTVAALPAAATAAAGARAFVSDANATTFASVVAAGGANGVPVYSDGTNWRIG